MPQIRLEAMKTHLGLRAKGRIPMEPICVGTAGWSLRKDQFELFPTSGTHLERYASRFNAVEINSSFYRPHRHSTYHRWAESTPDDFTFSVKIPKEITHSHRLRNTSQLIEAFLSEVSGLGSKLGALLIQLPPSLSFDISTAHSFFKDLRSRVLTALVCEPRHASWFSPEAVTVFHEQNVGRVIADPQLYANSGHNCEMSGTAYFRWHGSPRIYYSKYDNARLQALLAEVIRAAESRSSAWCIFDNTAEGAATENGLELLNMLLGSPQATLALADHSR